MFFQNAISSDQINSVISICFLLCINDEDFLKLTAKHARSWDIKINLLFLGTFCSLMTRGATSPFSPADSQVSKLQTKRHFRWGRGGQGRVWSDLSAGWSPPGGSHWGVFAESRPVESLPACGVRAALWVQPGVHHNQPQMSLQLHPTYLVQGWGWRSSRHFWGHGNWGLCLETPDNLYFPVWGEAHWVGCLYSSPSNTVSCRSSLH